MSSKSEGSASMRMFGAVARGLRENAGVTTDALAEHVGYSKSLLIKVERGERMPPPMFVEKATELYDCGELLARAAAHLERRSDFPEWFEPYADLERTAISLYTYSTLVFHGLLQTEGYAQAVLGARCPLLEADEVERRVEARLARRALFSRTPAPQLAFVIEESVLRRPIGGVEVLRMQLRRTLDIAEMRGATVQILPTSFETHAGYDGPMTLIENPRREQYAYLEAQEHSFLVDDRDEVSELHQRYAMIRSQALSVRESAKVIEQIAGEL
ncbi:Scr1 family TA system antitoxin-like transcriptional regulator [Actinacidiphila rubida]|uniref:Helix-turn-helix domain-containing protein n=1 Tax=Actinacidiphila rubida TaxID=310780 RepID=A0A1H8DFN6_9ACTN|nr:Scr1 family TA system antitoxin-like transcriptional regulator [Actinacidiphila rubida]SEN06111.1 Helix-turn-helix domain-containing protein [Actinacidiphila rubida]